MYFVNIFYIPLVMYFFFHTSFGFEGTFWDICDLHLNISFKPGNDEIFGNYKKDSTVHLIKSAIGAMQKIDPDPRFIIVNGDNVYHGDNEFLENLKTVINEIYLKFPNTSVIPTLGNHDVNPRNVISNNSTWCKNFFILWKSFFTKTNASEIESFEKGCFYTTEVYGKKGKLIIIVLNSLLWYARNKNINDDEEDPGGQFAWFENILRDARNTQQKVFIVGHIPPGLSEYSSITIQHLRPRFNERLQKILMDNADVIDAGFFAHQHTDAFKIVFDSNNKPVIPLFQCPSITPFRLSYIGSINPSIRLYKWNFSSANSQYIQYHTKIIKDDKQSSLNWTIEYISSSILKGLSANHLNDLVSDLSLKKSKYIVQFFNYHLSGQLHENSTCLPNSWCRCRFVCAMRNIDFAKFDICLNTCIQNSFPIWIICLSIFLTLILLFLIIAFVLYKFWYQKRRMKDLEIQDQQISKTDLEIKT